VFKKRHPSGATYPPISPTPAVASESSRAKLAASAQKVFDDIEIPLACLVACFRALSAALAEDDPALAITLATVAGDLDLVRHAAESLLSQAGR
jgi:predicted metal-binding protein